MTLTNRAMKFYLFRASISVITASSPLRHLFLFKQFSCTDLWRDVMQKKLHMECCIRPPPPFGLVLKL